MNSEEKKEDIQEAKEEGKKSQSGEEYQIPWTGGTVEYFSQVSNFDLQTRHELSLIREQFNLLNNFEAEVVAIKIVAQLLPGIMAGGNVFIKDSYGSTSELVLKEKQEHHHGS